MYQRLWWAGMGEVKAPEGWEACWEAGKHRFAGLRGRLARKGGNSVGGSVGDWEPGREGKRHQGVK